MNTTETETRILIDEARKCAKCVYLATEESVASDIARIINGLVNELESARASQPQQSPLTEQEKRELLRELKNTICDASFNMGVGGVGYCVKREDVEKAFEAGIEVIQPLERAKDYTAWLLENHDTGTPRYYAMTVMQEMVWVDDVDDAVHFARRADAERPATHGELHDLRIVEHMWPGGLPREPVVPPDEWDALEAKGSEQND